MPARIDLAGRRFGRLIVASEEPERARHGSIRWLCLCDCGTLVVVRSPDLRRGLVRSCGCYARELRVAALRTHGASRTCEYRTWKAMRKRCSNPSDKRWWQYGGRGIRVCERWQRFENFFADMGARPSPAHTIDRVDNDGWYGPDNCRWATQQEQSNNRSTNHRIEHHGRVGTLADWSRWTGISEDVICQRLETLGWTEEMALTVPTQRARLLQYQGRSLPLSAWAAETGIARRSIENRLRAGWSVERTLCTPPRRRLTTPEGRAKADGY